MMQLTCNFYYRFQPLVNTTGTLVDLTGKPGNGCNGA